MWDGPDWLPRGFYSKYALNNTWPSKWWNPTSTDYNGNTAAHPSNFFGDPFFDAEFMNGSPTLDNMGASYDYQREYLLQLGNATNSNGFWISKYPFVGTSNGGTPKLVSGSGYDTTYSMNGWNWFDAMELSLRLRNVFDDGSGRINTCLATESHLICGLYYMNNILDPWSRNSYVTFGNSTKITGQGQSVLGLNDLLGCANEITSSYANNGRILLRKNLYSDWGMSTIDPSSDLRRMCSKDNINVSRL